MNEEQKNALLEKHIDKFIATDVRGVFMFTKIDKGIKMLIIEMSELFRSKSCTNGGGSYYFSKNGFAIRSYDYSPELGKKNIQLRGYRNIWDDDIAIKDDFNNNEERDEYLENVLRALRGWANNWEGFIGKCGNGIIRKTRENEFIFAI